MINCYIGITELVQGIVLEAKIKCEIKPNILYAIPLPDLSCTIDIHITLHQCILGTIWDKGFDVAMVIEGDVLKNLFIYFICYNYAHWPLFAEMNQSKELL